MDFLEKGFVGTRDRFKEFSSWAFALEFAVQEGLRYERWWEARLPLEQIRRQYIKEQIEKGRRALEWGKMPSDVRPHAD